tara:strand:- start:591 stop:749 length:159 start_codon:yes stop_codon:yes gene_type:complete
MSNPVSQPKIDKKVIKSACPAKQRLSVTIQIEGGIAVGVVNKLLKSTEITAN